MSLFEALSLAPISRGFIVLIISGVIFPLTGVFIVRLNLVPLRFTLMHGSLLGGIIALACGLNAPLLLKISPFLGTIALASGLNPLFMAIIINSLIILSIGPVQKYSNLRITDVTSFLMVATIGLSFALIYKFSIPAFDAFKFLWGNLYAVTETELIIISIFALFLIAFVFFYFRKITAILFNKDISYSSGVNEKRFSLIILVITGLTVSLAMKITGTLLLDSLLILPALTAAVLAGNTKQLFLFSSISGLISSLTGFFISIYIDLPAGPSIAISSSLLFLITVISKKIIVYYQNSQKFL